MTVKGKVGDCAHAAEVLQRKLNPSASNCRSRHATAVLVFWHHTQPRPSLIDVRCRGANTANPVRTGVAKGTLRSCRTKFQATFKIEDTRDPINNTRLY